MRFENDEVLAFDCDGVLVTPDNGFLKACAAVSGVDPTGMTWTTYNHFERFGLTHGQFLQAIIDHQALETAELRPGVRAAIQLARAHGLKTAIVTARDFHPNKQVTDQYMRAHGLHFDFIRVVGDKESKVDAVKSLGKVIGYTDDLTSHLRSLREAGLDVPLCLMDQPWNAKDEGFDRVASVPHFVEHVLEHYRRLGDRPRLIA